MIRALCRAWPLFEPPTSTYCVLAHARGLQNKAYDADFDPDELAEARKWRASFNENSLPKGQTSYSRSSGPGGQHVNKLVVTYLRLNQYYGGYLTHVGLRAKQPPFGQ